MKIRINQSNIYNIKDLLIYFSILTLGCGNINGVLPLNLTQMIIIILFIIIILKQLYYKEIKVPKIILWISIYIFFITFVLNQNNFENLKTFGIIFIYLYAVYFYVLHTSFYKITKMLYNISFIIAFIGVLQQIGYLFNVSMFYDFSYLGINNAISFSGPFMRITSILTEPAHLSNLLLPGICLTIYSIINNYELLYVKKWKNFIIVLASIFTFSAIVYLTFFGIILYYILFVVKEFYKKFIVVFITILSTIFILNIFQDSLHIIEEKILSFTTLNQLNSTNLSSFAIISNLQIAIEKLKDMNLLGTGIDTHAKSYFEYIHTLYRYDDIILYLNYEDASSIYIRILSEFGIVGLALYVLFLIKMLFLKRKKKYLSTTFILNRVAVIGIIMYGIRMGNYVNSYFILLLILSILTYKVMKEKNELGLNSI